MPTTIPEGLDDILDELNKSDEANNPSAPIGHGLNPNDKPAPKKIIPKFDDVLRDIGVRENDIRALHTQMRDELGRN